MKTRMSPLTFAYFFSIENCSPDAAFNWSGRAIKDLDIFLKINVSNQVYAAIALGSGDLKSGSEQHFNEPASSNHLYDLILHVIGIFVYLCWTNRWRHLECT